MANVVLVCRGLSGDGKGNMNAVFDSFDGSTHGIKRVIVEANGHEFEYGKEYQIQISSIPISEKSSITN